MRPIALKHYLEAGLRHFRFSSESEWPLKPPEPRSPITQCRHGNNIPIKTKTWTLWLTLQFLHGCFRFHSVCVRYVTECCFKDRIQQLQQRYCFRASHLTGWFKMWRNKKNKHNHTGWFSPRAWHSVFYCIKAKSTKNLSLCAHLLLSSSGDWRPHAGARTHTQQVKSTKQEGDMLLVSKPHWTAPMWEHFSVSAGRGEHGNVNKPAVDSTVQLTENTQHKAIISTF